VNLLTGPGLAALMSLPGIGEVRAVALAEAFGSWQALAVAGEDHLVAILKPATTAKVLPHLTEQPPALNLPAGVRVISIYDPEYPPRLRNIRKAPTLLWVTGTLPPPDAPAVAIVGTRNPTPFGEAAATQAARGAVEHGISVVSGLARGIDSIAAQTAVSAGAPTWAVLGQGVDTIEAGSDRATLADRILATGGGLLAEVPPGTAVVKHLLTARNRIQSGLSDAVYIAQSGLPADGPAGTMHAARYALEHQRMLVVPRPSGKWAAEPRSAGNLALTDPHGCDPAAVYADQPSLAAIVAARHPVADLVLNHRDDLPLLWQRLAAVPTPL